MNRNLPAKILLVGMRMNGLLGCQSRDVGSDISPQTTRRIQLLWRGISSHQCIVIITTAIQRKETETCLTIPSITTPRKNGTASMQVDRHLTMTTKRTTDSIGITTRRTKMRSPNTSLGAETAEGGELTTLATTRKVARGTMGTTTNGITVAMARATCTMDIIDLSLQNPKGLF